MGGLIVMLIRRKKSVFVGFFLRSANRDQANGFFTQLDFKFRTWLQFHHGCVGLANKKVAIALNFGDVAKLATAFANTTFTSKADTLGF